MTSSDVIAGGNMSEETMTEGQEQSENNSSPEIGNIKAEFERKLSNTESQLVELKTQNEQLMAQLSSLADNISKSPVQSTSDDDLETLMYSDPKKYTEMLEERAERRVLSKIEQQTKSQSEKTAILNSLVSQYPELSDQTNPLTKKAVEIYNSLPEGQKNSPMAYEVVVSRAASELGVAPVSKRQKSNDDFTMPGGASEGSKRKRSSDDIPETTKQFAEIMGLDLNNEKIKKSLEKLSKEKNWQQYKRRK